MPNHFDMSEFPKGSRTFFSLYNRWKNKMIRSGKSHYIKIDWWGEICDQMTRAIGTYSATEVMRPLKSAADEHTWYLPVMTSMTTAPAEKRYEFSISLIRIPQDSDFLKINVDYSLELTKGEKVPKAEEQIE